MIYISLSLRYQRQLSLICPDIVESFFKEAIEATVQNGGKFSRSFSGCIFTFTDTDLCCVFSVSLLLDTLLSLIKKREDRIKEYLIFVDYCENNISPEHIADRKSVCDNMILEDGAVLLNGGAVTLLRPYSNCVRLENSSLYSYCGQKINVDFDSSSEDGLLLPEKVFLYPPPGASACGNSSLVSAFINLISKLSELFKPEDFLSKKEAAVFACAGKAVDRFASLRFSTEQPSYRLKGCEEYIQLFFTAFSRAKVERKQTKFIGIEIPDGYFNRNETDRMKYMLLDTCSFISVDDGASSVEEKKLYGFEIPPDIMDAAYLIYRASNFLYSGEMTALFAFLGKHGSFRKAVEIWLSASGFPEKTGFSSSVLKLEKQEFPPRVNRERLDKYLFDFLWKKYEDGSLLAGRDFLDNLSCLGQKIPDSFLTATVYRDSDQSGITGDLQENFSGERTAAAIVGLAEAEKKLRRGLFKEAQEITKQVLHDFQQAGIIAGEYEVFSFSARFSFAKHGVSGGDSITYMEYASENADKMHDPDARMRCLFDFASMHLLSGNFDAALINVRKLKETAFLFYDKGWEAVALFLEGKILFLLGDYRAAEKQFQNTETFCMSYGITRASLLCQAWAARSRVYQTKNPQEFEKLKTLAPSIPEAWLFALEEAAKTYGRNQFGFSGKEALLEGFPERMQDSATAEIFTFPEKWTWVSSFSLTEDRFLCGIKCGKILYPLYSSFYAFCSALYGGDCNEARTEIDGYARDTQSFTNPYLYIFYYMCYELENLISGRNSTDALSFLSRSFKSIQVDANNIADTMMREKFLREPYWNSLLYSAAKENKLI